MFDLLGLNALLAGLDGFSTHRLLVTVFNLPELYTLSLE
jgi:hypothetical protein